jgi:murein peptide amidase A
VTPLRLASRLLALCALAATIAAVAAMVVQALPEGPRGGGAEAGPAAAPRPPARGLTWRAVGSSARGRRILAARLASGRPGRVTLVVGCIHGDECAGRAIARRLIALGPPARGELWVLPQLNPDGRRRGWRLNGRGVDLNRNFSAGWRHAGAAGDPQYSGPRPFSEPEARAARRLILRVRPHVTIWYHQPLALVRAWGGSVAAARRYARAAGLPFRRLRWPHGTAPRWQNRRLPGSASFVVELPPGRLSAAAVRRQARAVLAFSRRA